MMRSRHRVPWFILFFLLCTFPLAAQTAGTLDSTFGVNGVATFVMSGGLAYGGGVRQADGKLIVTGSATNSDYDFAAVRFTADGRIDSTYGTNGKTTLSVKINDIVYGSTLQPDGKLIIVGSTTADWSDYDFCAVRLDTNGLPDNTFGTNGKASFSLPRINEAHAAAVQPDGKILVSGTGYYDDYSAKQVLLLMRMNADGSFDNTFNNGNGWSTYSGSAELGYSMWNYAMTVQSDGKILLSGTSNTTGFGTTMLVYRFNANGTIDNSFDWSATRYADGLNAGGIAYAVTTQRDGKIIAAGYTHNDFYVCRFNTGGSIDASFGGSLGAWTSLSSSNTDEIRSCIVQDDGKILVGGASDYNLGLARFNANGTLDNSFGTGGNVVTDLGNYDEIYTVISDPGTGKILVLARSGDNFVAARYHGYTKTNDAPTQSASSVTAVLATQTTATFRWTKGNGTSRIAILRVDSAVAAYPTDGYVYSSSSAFGGGTNLGSSQYPVYEGTDSVVTVSGLILGKTYHLAVYEYNGTGDSRTYRRTSPARGSITIAPLAGFDGSSYVVKFDGSNDHIGKANVTQGDGPFTVEAWVYVNGSNLASAGLFNRGGNVTSNLIWKFNLHNDFARIDFYSTNVRTNTAPLGKTVIGTTVVKNNAWHHIAGGYDGSDIFLYVDGNLEGKTSYAGLTLNTSSQPLMIGFDSCCGSRPFNGMMAEFRMWNTARTQEQIRENMHKRIPANDPSLIAYFHFDDAGGSTTRDSVSGGDAVLLNFNYNSNSGFIKSNPPFGPYGAAVSSSGVPVSVGEAGAQLTATMSSIADSVNGLGLYAFGTAASMVSDVPVLIGELRSQRTWGVQKKGSRTDTTQIVIDYSGTSITSAYAKLISRSNAAAAWTDVSGQFTHDAMNRTFTRTGSTSSAEYSIATTNNDPLPVELSSFTAAVQGKGILLQWGTATEIANAGFAVERRMQNTERWETIGFVPGSGTSNVPKQYSYIDASVAGARTYRLRLVDRNGAFTYSPERSIEEGAVPKIFSLAQNFPNPFNPSTTLRFTLDQPGMTSLIVFDAVGRQVRVLADEMMQPGTVYERKFNGEECASGLYFARLQSSGKTQVMKMLLMK